MCEWPGRSYLQCLVARRAAALLLRREPALSAPAATTAAPTYLARSGWAGTCCSPGHHSARSPPPCTPLPATGRGKVAEHVRKSCALSRRRLATPSRESSAPPARPGEAGPSEAPARRRRAPYDLQGRPEGLPSRRNPAAKARSPQGCKKAADLRFGLCQGCKSAADLRFGKKKRFHLFNLPPPNSALWASVKVLGSGGAVRHR